MPGAAATVRDFAADDGPRSLRPRSYLGKEETMAWMSSQVVAPDGTLEITVDGFYEGDTYETPFQFKDHPLGHKIVHLKILSDNFRAEAALFAELEALETVTINGLYLSVGAGCFQKCKKLKTVVIDNHRPFNLLDACFEECTELTAFNGTVKSVRTRAFSQCHNLQHFPFETVENIHHLAFAYCVELTKVKCEHPNGTKLLGKSFYHCSGLEEFYLGGLIPMYDEIELRRRALQVQHTGALTRAFEYCDSLKRFYLSSCRSVDIVELIAYDTLDYLYILTPEGQTPNLDYWRSKADVLKPNYQHKFRNVAINGDPSILKVLDLTLWPQKIAPLTEVRLDEKGHFMETYPDYPPSRRAFSVMASNLHNQDLPILPKEMVNEIMRRDHYTWPIT